MTGLKSIVKIAAFLLILSLLLYGINGVLQPKYNYSNNIWPTTSTYRSFYTMDRNSVDVLFIGSSFCVNGFSPQEIYNQYGIRSYNLGSEQQSLFLSYYWLKEALAYQSPSVVVLEGRFLQALFPEGVVNTTEGLIRKCLDPMRISKVKLQAVNDLCAQDERQIKASWFLTNIRFHDRWKDLKEVDFDDGLNASAPLKGWAPGDAGPLYGYEPLANAEDGAYKDLDYGSIQYFGRIAELCRERGITLLLVNIPNSISSGLYHAYQELAAEYGVDYIELGEENTWQEMGIEMPRENPCIHGNIWGNIKVSRYIGRLLQEKYGVPAVQDPQYEETRAFYDHVVAAQRLKEIEDPAEYLALLQDDQFDVFITVTAEAAASLSDAAKEQLRALGLRQTWEGAGDGWDKYTAVITDEGIREETGSDIWVTGRFRSRNNTYDLKSFGSGESTYSALTLDDQEYSFDPQGLAVLVYDTVTRTLVGNATFR